MPTALLVFEFIGTSELMIIAVVALIIFGPRKLPDLGRSLGRSLAEFKRASEDFKRTWEYEVEIEKRKPAADPAPAAQPDAYGDDAAASLPAYDAGAGDFDGSQPQTVARGAGAEDEHAWDVATGRAATRPADRDEDELNAS